MPEESLSKLAQILERYLRAKFVDMPALAITELEKLQDGWESDNYLLTFEYGAPPTRAKWVWRIYSGVGSHAKAAHEYDSIQKLYAAGYPVPQVYLLENDISPLGRPFIIMEYIPGEMMWHLLDHASVEEQGRLIDRFCQLFVQLHSLDWRQFASSLPAGEPFFFIDRLLGDASTLVRNFPDVDAAPFFGWVAHRRNLFACPRPSPVHQDFHPGNILIKEDNHALVIDWTNFDVTDPRFDLAWTLVLAHAHGKPDWRDKILRGYQRHAGVPVENIEVFEAIACARRLFDLTVSLTHGAERLGMNIGATESIRARMEAHRRVYRLFTERTGLQIKAFASLFG